MLLLPTWAFAEIPAPAAPTPLQKVGEAKLTVLFWDIYHSSLYSEDGTYYRGQRPLRLDIQYLRDIAATALVERTQAEWEDQGLAHENQPQWLAELGRLWPDVTQNDVLTLELDENDRSTFFHNGVRLGTIDDTGFGQHFLDIWLSPGTSRPELRLALIGEVR
jgi:hypothetical protein